MSSCLFDCTLGLFCKKGEFASKFFSLRLDYFQKGDRTISTISSPEIVSIPLNEWVGVLCVVVFKS